jgi:protein TonB
MSLKAYFAALAAGAAVLAGQTPASAQMDSSMLDRFYPPAARAAGVSGYVVLDCVVKQDQKLGDCQVIEESPTGYGFGEASLKAARVFKMSLTTTQGDQVPGDGLRVKIPIRWTLQRPATGPR